METIVLGYTFNCVLASDQYSRQLLKSTGSAAGDLYEGADISRSLLLGTCQASGMPVAVQKYLQISSITIHEIQFITARIFNCEYILRT
jgi:hypothetical protein